MTFHGWPVEAISFYEGLHADNSKAYWQDHKHIYDTSVLAPMTELLSELDAEFGAGKVFRPYRDVRFSVDKRPYQTHIGARIGDYGYVQLSADGLAAACGMYVLAADQLDRYRRAVADDHTGEELATIAAYARAAGLTLTAHDALKTAPRGYPKDHPRLDLLRNKGLVTWRDWPTGPWLGKRTAKDRVVGLLRASVPLRDWLTEHVGPTTIEPDRSR